jgi:tryptophan synthase alpha chain
MRAISTALVGAPPPIFGCGISTPDHVRAALDAGAAGVICGSAIVDLVARGGDVAAFVRSLKSAMRERVTTAVN